MPASELPASATTGQPDKPPSSNKPSEPVCDSDSGSGIGLNHDAKGNDRDAIVGVLTYHFLRNRTIHLLTRVAELQVGDDAVAGVTVYVAMAGRPIPGSEALAGLRANLYRFEFTLEEEEAGWRLTRATWRPAEPKDFL